MLITLQYWRVWWFLPYISMNQPWVYICPTCVPPSWTSLPPPSTLHPSGLSQGTSFGCPASCIKFVLVIYFTYGNIHVSLLSSHIIPPSPSFTESKGLFFTFVSLLLSYIWGHLCHLSKFYIYALIYYNLCFSFCLLHSVYSRHLFFLNMWCSNIFSSSVIFLTFWIRSFISKLFLFWWISFGHVFIFCIVFFLFFCHQV